MSGMDGDPGPPMLDPASPLFGLGYSPAVRPVETRRFGPEGVEERMVEIAEEIPVALAYNGRPHVVLMASPTDLEDFAIGFSLTEGLINDAAEIRTVAVARHSRGIEVDVRLKGEREAGAGDRTRALVGRTGCGLCGVTAIDQALRLVEPLPFRRFGWEAVIRAVAALPDRQHLNASTGAMHAAGWADASGTLEIVREDVGRHNALDKVIGSLLRRADRDANGFLVVTSRASYELVQKCAIARVGLLAAVSRPTGLAIRLADDIGIVLAALVRGDSGNVYAHADRIDRREAVLADHPT